MLLSLTRRPEQGASRCRQQILVAAMVLLSVSGCATKPPSRQDNICHIFEEKYSWYKASKKSEKKWGVPIPVMMSFVYQESRYRSNAKPPRRKILWVIPGPRISSAYGYPQAKDETWKAYRQSTGNFWANRDDFRDAIDFIGWYNVQSHKRNKIAKTDSFNLYLAYHEGQGGFSRATYKKKPWLLTVANKVKKKSERYTVQLSGCRESLDDRSWWRF